MMNDITMTVPTWMLNTYKHTSREATKSKNKATGDDALNIAAHAYTSWSELLIEANWALVGDRDGNEDGSEWRHPDATNHRSATITNSCLFVYTPGTVFGSEWVTEHEVPRGITLYRAFCFIRHGADTAEARTRATAELRAAALRTRRVRDPRVELVHVPRDEEEATTEDATDSETTVEDGDGGRQSDTDDGRPLRLLLPSPSQPMPVARILVHESHTRGDDLLLRHWRGGWWFWSITRWIEVEDRALDAVLYRFTEHAVYEDPKTAGAAKLLAALFGPGNTGLLPWAPTDRKIRDLGKALAAVCHLRADTRTPSWLSGPEDDPAHLFVSVRNGLLNITTRELQPHTPTLFNMTTVPFDYDPDAPTPEQFLKFLKELWPDDPASIAALQEFFGYVISGRIDLHKILLMVGPTRAGKGVLTRLLKELVGFGNYAGPTLASLGTNFGLEPLLGKSLAVISDARLGGANTEQVVERLLAISGEDNIDVQRKFKTAWNGTLPARFVVVSNELPRFGDASGAIANRFIVVVLTNSWLNHEDPKLTDKLRGDLPGILNWAFDGLERLEANNGHFTVPASSKDAISTLQDLASPVAAFVRDRCVRGEHSVLCSALYTAWSTWADDNGHKPGNAQSFGRDLRAVVPGIQVHQVRDGDIVTRLRVYRGVKLRSDEDA